MKVRGAFIICSVVTRMKLLVWKGILLFVIVIILFYLYNERVLYLQNLIESIWMLLLFYEF